MPLKDERWRSSTWYFNARGKSSRESLQKGRLEVYWIFDNNIGMPGLAGRVWYGPEVSE